MKKKSLKPLTILLIFLAFYLINTINVQYRNLFFLENIQVELIKDNYNYINNKIEVELEEIHVES